MIKHFQSPSAPKPGGPYSHAVIAGGLAFLSGQRPVDPSTGSIPADFGSQVRQVFDNIGVVLTDLGVGFGDVVKVGGYLSDLARFDEYNVIYRTYFSEPYPARTTVQCVLRGIDVEVDVVVALPDNI